MRTHADPAQATKSQAVAPAEPQQQMGEKPVVPFTDNRPVATQLRAMQEMANNSAQVKQLRAYQRMADSHALQKKARQKKEETRQPRPSPLQQKKAETGLADSVTPGRENVRGFSLEAVQMKNEPVVQRVIQVAGAPQTVQQVVTHFAGSPQAITQAQEQILQSWAGVATIHNFTASQGRTAWEKIPLALGRAQARPAVPPAPFSAAHFQFITQSGGGRLPTLYFDGGGQTGRLRQQHGSGPLAEVDPQPKTRISFDNRFDRTAFVTALRHSRDNDVAFVDPVPGTYNPPAAGQFLLEYYMAGGGVAGGWHPSEGLVQPVPAAINNDVAITGIYNNIIGAQNNDDGCCSCCFITTACMVSKGLPDDCEELQALREYRDGYLLQRDHGRELFQFYYSYSPAIVEGINRQPDAKQIYNGLYTVIQQCVSCIRRRDLEEAFLIYVKMVLRLHDKYAPQTVIPDYLQTILAKSLQ